MRNKTRHFPRKSASRWFRGETVLNMLLMILLLGLLIGNHAFFSAEQSYKTSDVHIGVEDTNVFPASVYHRPSVRIFTGTSYPSTIELKRKEFQPEVCLDLAQEFFDLTTFFPSNKEEAKTYIQIRQAVVNSIKRLAQTSTSCDLFGAVDEATGEFQMITFPVSLPSEAVCSEVTSEILRTKSYIKRTKVTVPWFLFRPNLVLLTKLLLEQKVMVEIEAFTESSVGDLSSTAFMSEGCPRFKSILSSNNRYKVMFHKVMRADLLNQLKKLSQLMDTLPQETKLSINIFDEAGEKINLMNPSKVKKVAKKSNSHKPTLVFVAGLEGVGHHMFSDVGRKLSHETVYMALTNYLTERSTDMQKLEFLRNQLVTSLQLLEFEQQVFYLNTVFTTHPVNMYSFPWGGPKCLLKKFARTVCNIDVQELVSIINDAGFDLRVILLKRSFKSSIVSAAINRNFGTVTSQTRLLGQSWSLLNSGLQEISPDFVLEMNYEHVASEAENTYKKIACHLGLRDDSSEYQQMMSAMLSAAHISAGNKKTQSKVLSEEEAVLIEDEFLAVFEDSYPE